jgi:hypothetical protein
MDSAASAMGSATAGGGVASTNSKWPRSSVQSAMIRRITSQLNAESPSSRIQLPSCSWALKTRSIVPSGPAVKSS